MTQANRLRALTPSETANPPLSCHTRCKNLVRRREASMSERKRTLAVV